MQAYADRDLADQLVIDAICMRLSAGIETLARLDPVVLAELFGDIWSEMWGMRNRIAHGYLLVDTTIVSQTIQDDIPQIVAAILRRAGWRCRGPELVVSLLVSVALIREQ